MICPHIYKTCWYRITWSGRFKLLNEVCHCGHVRERTIRISQQPSTYPSKVWIHA